MSLIAAALVLSCSLCLAEDFPENTNKIKSLTVEQAAELAKFDMISHGMGFVLRLNGLTSINKDVAQELAKSKAGQLRLDGLTSIDKEVAQELAQFKGGILHFDGLTSLDKVVA